jgi:uncharacterized protein (DUF2062 family)
MNLLRHIAETLREGWVDAIQTLAICALVAAAMYAMLAHH